MDIATAKQILTKDNPANLYDVVQPALEIADIRGLLVEGSFSKPEAVRYNCVRVLHRAIERCPELFYPYWDRFEAMLDSPNSFYRSSSSEAIAILSSVDKDRRLDPIFKQYLRLLNDPKVMVAHYFIITLGWIYRARADFRSQILKRLLNIDQSRPPSSQHDILKADILGVFEEVFDLFTAPEKKRVLAFAEAQLESSSPKARKAAKEFLKRHS